MLSKYLVSNTNKHQDTDDFLNIMYTMSFYPSITKPSRITSSSATLIDNIFTNDAQYSCTNGLLICDISDHLPVFTVRDWKYRKRSNYKVASQKHLQTEQTTNALFSALLEQDWSLVYNENNVDRAYNNFLKIFMMLYNRFCPIINVINENRYKNCPWLTKGLKNACKKKNNLYVKFIKLRTKDSELKYKMYKNKLTTIIRNNKKLYYKKKVEENKNNPKKVWGVLNTILNKSTNKKEYPEYFLIENMENHNQQEVVNKFNEFFVQVGPQLAGNIPNTGANNAFKIDRNTKTMFLSAADEAEVSEQ